MLSPLRGALGRVRGRVAGVWMNQPAPLRSQIVAFLLVVGTLFTIHYLVFCWPQPFYIEDSAISFSYARNLVEGHGLVAYPGAERVEGYSNALWTFLIAGFYAVGIQPWVTAKVMGWGFGAVALLASLGLARRARPAFFRDGVGMVAILAPLLLAASTQFVLWDSSGLENSLFCALLGGGAYLLAREIQDGVAAPWSALCFFGLTMTRPDGMAYAAVALLTRVCGTVVRRQWKALALWVVAAGIPYAAYNAWRYDYFGWWFPNTYYAKEKMVRPFLWSGAGWKMVRDYASGYGVGWMAPLVVLALVGPPRGRSEGSRWGGWRWWTGVAVVAIYAVATLWDGRTGVPGVALATAPMRWFTRNWPDLRVYALLAGAVVLGLTTLTRRGWEVRAFLWASLCSGVFFCVWAGGDWMKGFRWFSLTSVPLFTLMAVGAGYLVEGLPFAARRIAGRVPVATLYGIAAVVGLGFPNIKGSRDFAADPETQPRDIRKRVNYMSWVQRRLGLEEVNLLDVDMGAHLWYTDWYITDLAGLIDIPVSRHKWQRSFTDDYIFGEWNPDFAHLHGSWAKTTRIQQSPLWAQRYIEIPGYPSGRRALHVGNNIRKDLVVDAEYTGTAGRAARFGGDVTLDGWDIPSPEIAPGGKLYVSTSWEGGVKTDGFRVVAFLADDQGHLHAAEVAPGYDWYPPDRWQVGEHVRGRWNIAVPESLPPGTYDFGFVLLDERTGRVLPLLADGSPAADGSATADTAVGAATDGATPPSDGAPIGTVGTATPGAADPGAGNLAAPPVAAGQVRYMRGEWLAKGAVRLVSVDEAMKAATDDEKAALDLAGSGDCDGARERFRDARRHIARNDAWYDKHKPPFDAAIVACELSRAKAETDPVVAAQFVIAARRIDPDGPTVRAVSVPLGEKLEALGDDRAAKGDHEGAFRAYSAAVHVDSARVWARRKAEDERDTRLGINGKEPEKNVPAAKPASRAKPARGEPVGPDEAQPEDPDDPQPELLRPGEAGPEGLDPGLPE